MDLLFSAEGRQWPIRLTGQSPRTERRLLDALPLPLQLHTPKIAGSHIYWHAPFVEDVEGATHVLAAAAGAFIYWPVRQFLEITFAPLQAENAEITVLGHLDAPIEGITELAATLKRDQGRRILRGHLERNGPAPASTPDATTAETVPPALASLIDRRRAIWRDCPPDIARLTQSRAIMHPAGPVFAAEAEARVLHEHLWWLRGDLGRRPEPVLRQAAAIALDKAATRLRDFCHLTDSADLLFALKAEMEGDLSLPVLLEEAILIAGRIGAWIDLLIPWNDLNEAFRAALDAGGRG